MEYILTEILKNAFRATVEQHQKQHSGRDGTNGNASDPAMHQHPLPPVLITIVAPPRLPGIDRPAVLSLRIRDQGGGVAPTNMARIFSYAFTTAGRRASGHQDRHGRRRGGAYGGSSSSSTRDGGSGGGPYAAQHIGGAAAALGGSGMGAGGVNNLFEEITGKGVQTGLGTIAGLGFGLPMSRLYAQ